LAKTGYAVRSFYKEFMQEASKCYVDALEHEKPHVPLLVVLYIKIQSHARHFISSGTCSCRGSAQSHC
jgi:hypothetical protein